MVAATGACWTVARLGTPSTSETLAGSVAITCGAAEEIVVVNMGWLRGVSMLRSAFKKVANKLFRRELE